MKGPGCECQSAQADPLPLAVEPLPMAAELRLTHGHQQVLLIPARQVAGTGLVFGGLGITYCAYTVSLINVL